MEIGNRSGDKDGGSPRVKPRRAVTTASAGRAQGKTKPVRRSDEVAQTNAGVSGIYERAERVIRFIECLKIPSGVGSGEPFALEEWQKQFIRAVYGPVNERGHRKIRRALLSIARKNGKTALAAALVLVHLVGPEAKRNGEVYSAASDRNQAGHIYKMAKQMVELDDELRAVCNPLDSVKRIVVMHTGSFYASLSADARRQHGFNPSFVIGDELAQWLGREMYDVLATSFGAQEEGLFLCISTQSSDPESVMTDMADDAIKLENGELDDPTFHGTVYRVPDDADPWDENNWKLANPALGTFRVLDDMRAAAAKAKRSPSAEAAFRNLYLNQRVDGVQAFVNSADWRACDTEIPDGELTGLPCYAALDLSSRTDLSSLTLTWELADGRVAVRNWFWLPGDEIQDREKNDGAPYRVWRDKGFMTLCASRTVDYAEIVAVITELQAKYNIRALAYDQWNIGAFTNAILALGAVSIVPLLIGHKQDFRHMAPAITALETAILEHKICHGGNPVLTYCVSNVKLIRDQSENRRFDKRKRNRRIDGAVTLTMARSPLTLAHNPDTRARSYLETGPVEMI